MNYFQCLELEQQAEPGDDELPDRLLQLHQAAAAAAVSEWERQQAEPVDLDQQVRDITAGIGLPPVESPVVPDPVIDCDCGRRWCWTDDAGWSSKQAEPVLQTCNCRWDGDKQVQQCGLHHAHAVALHEWAERAKKAEQQAEPVAEPAFEIGYGGGGGRGGPVVWVGLKEVEVSDIYARRAIEAALEQKNAKQAQQAEPVADDCTPNHFCGYRWIHKPIGEICNRCGHAGSNNPSF